VSVCIAIVFSVMPASHRHRGAKEGLDSGWVEGIRSYQIIIQEQVRSLTWGLFSALSVVGTPCSTHAIGVVSDGQRLGRVEQDRGRVQRCRIYNRCRSIVGIAWSSRGCRWLRWVELNMSCVIKVARNVVWIWTSATATATTLLGVLLVQLVYV